MFFVLTDDDNDSSATEANIAKTLRSFVSLSPVVLFFMFSYVANRRRANRFVFLSSGLSCPNKGNFQHRADSLLELLFTKENARIFRQ